MVRRRFYDDDDDENSDSYGYGSSYDEHSDEGSGHRSRGFLGRLRNSKLNPWQGAAIFAFILSIWFAMNQPASGSIGAFLYAAVTYYMLGFVFFYTARLARRYLSAVKETDSEEGQEEETLSSWDRPAWGDEDSEAFTEEEQRKLNDIAISLTPVREHYDVIELKNVWKFWEPEQRSVTATSEPYTVAPRNRKLRK